MTEADRARLQFLLSHIQTLSDRYWHTFTGPLRAMDAHAWVGPGASRDFARRLDDGDARLHAELRRALRLVQDELARPASPLKP